MAAMVNESFRLPAGREIFAGWTVKQVQIAARAAFKYLAKILI